MSTTLSILVVLWLVALTALAITFYFILSRKLDEIDSKVSTIRSDCETTLCHCESIADRQIEYHTTTVDHLKGFGLFWNGYLPSMTRQAVRWTLLLSLNPNLIERSRW